MEINASKTHNGITVVIHEITATTVYYARSDGDGWILRRMSRAEFERQWEAV